eukprot:625049-Alexandrium_andersonii.AAC.1
MSASLVGSEMCIRDSEGTAPWPGGQHERTRASQCPVAPLFPASRAPISGCLLYTSDAADDM